MAPTLNPLRVRDSRLQVFTLLDHVRPVDEWCARYLGADVRIHGVTHPQQLQGFQDAVFVRLICVDLPRDRMADGLETHARALGFTILTIDDTNYRARYGGGR